MLSQDEAGKVVYASSFSKTVCPGIRVGYLVGPQAVIKQIQAIATNTYISPNMVAQSIVNQFARSGRMDGAIATVKNALRERRDTLVAALERELPEARFPPPEGGYFMWVELPEGIDVAELEKAAERARACCSSRAPTSCSRAARTRCGSRTPASTPEQIDEGVTRLAEAVRVAWRRGIASPRPRPRRSSASCSAGGDRGRCAVASCSRRLLARALRPRADARRCAADLVARGWAAWNIEYRRLGRQRRRLAAARSTTSAPAIDHLARARTAAARPRPRGRDRALRRRAPRGVGRDARARRACR